MGSVSGSGRSPGEVNGYPLQCSCLEKFMDRGAWRATAHGFAKLDTTGHTRACTVSQRVQAVHLGHVSLRCLELHLTHVWTRGANLCPALPVWALRWGVLIAHAPRLQPWAPCCWLPGVPLACSYQLGKCYFLCLS